MPNGQVTVSVGIAIWPSNAQSMEELIHCADKALYESKRMARNRVEVYFSALDEIRDVLGDSPNGMPVITIKSLLLLMQSRDRYTYHAPDSWRGDTAPDNYGRGNPQRGTVPPRALERRRLSHRHLQKTYPFVIQDHMRSRRFRSHDF